MCKVMVNDISVSYSICTGVKKEGISYVVIKCDGNILFKNLLEGKFGFSYTDCTCIFVVYYFLGK